MRMSEDMFDLVLGLWLVVIPLLGFCFMAWWIHHSSQWRVGRPATEFGTVRFFVLNALLLIPFLGCTMASLFLLNPLDKPSVPIPDLTMFVYIIVLHVICVPMPLIIIGSFWLALSKLSSLVHSFIGMIVSYVGTVLVFCLRLWESGFTVYRANGMVWNQASFGSGNLGYEFIFWAAYFLLFTTGGYVIVEWLKCKRAE